MSEIAAITRLREQRNALIEQMRGVIDTADSESRDLTAEELQEVETREVEIKGFDGQINARERVLGMEPRLRVGDERMLTGTRETATTGGEQQDPTASDEYRTAFMGYIRTGAPEYRDALLAPNSAGGFTVPREFMAQLVEYRTHFGVIRQVSNTFSTTGGQTMDLPLLTGRGAAGWTNEAAAYNETDEVFGSVVFGAHKMTRIVQVSEELLQDSAFDIGGLLARRFGQSLAVLENTSFITGDGSGKPTGITNAAGLATGKTTSGATAITFDEVIDLIHSVTAPYRSPESKFIMADSTVSYLRKIKTGVASDLRYIWQTSAEAGVPDRLFGYPVFIDPDMPAIATGNDTIAFGDFSQAYWIRDAGPIQIKRLDERYADTGQVGFLCSARVDGKVVDNGAAKLLTQA